MRKRKSLFFSLLVFVLMLVQCPVFSQTDKVLVDLADEMYSFGDYEDAIGLYLQSINENPDNIRANYQLGECYLRTSHSKGKAIKHFLKAYDLDPEYTNMILYKVAESYRFAYEFDEAISYYKLFKEELEIHRRIFEGLDTYELKDLADRRVFECLNAKQFINAPTSVQIENLGDVINSEENDYAPVISAENDVLIFTSRREGGIGILKDVDNKYFEDIWTSKLKNGNWTEPINIGQPINSDNHESNLCLSPLGNYLYIYKTENSGDIFISENINGTWSEPKSLGSPINTEYKEVSAFETTDGRRLFMCSDRPGGIGKSDIYVCDKNLEGKWSEPKLLSDVVNTAYDEEGPFFISESNTLYFSSKGHKGMGGYDLYRTQYNPENDTWTEPQNLGYPINSTDDDLYFTMSSDGKTGYYATFKEDSRGENDIYRIFPADGSNDKPSDTDSVVSDVPIEGAIVLNFQVFDYDSGEPVVAHVDLVDKETDVKLFSGEINGSFRHAFENKNATTVIVLVESSGYLFQTVKVKIPEFTGESIVIERKLGMRKPKENVANIMRNVYFDFNKATLKKESYNEIEKLVKMLKANPSMRIEINGHTDFIGGAAYNKELSRQRASAVRDYLINKGGIDGTRVTAIGYGSERPLASNDDEEEGRELNRRTEFTILSQ